MIEHWIIAVDKELWRQLTEDRSSIAQEALKAALHGVFIYSHILSFVNDSYVPISLEEAVKWGVVDGVTLNCRHYNARIDPKDVLASSEKK